MAEKIGMGIGKLGFSNAVFKRKFRFTFELTNICGNSTIPSHYVKVAARPNLIIEETELNHLNATTWVPGKAKWETMDVTYIDVATDEMAPLYSWLSSLYNFTNPAILNMGSQQRDYTAVGVLKLWDGCGQLIERWTMRNMWPTSINFGELSYEESSFAEINLTLRYSDVLYEPICPKFAIKSCCSPCGS